jgi:hypothetical protein
LDPVVVLGNEYLVPAPGALDNHLGALGRRAAPLDTGGNQFDDARLAYLWFRAFAMSVVPVSTLGFRARPATGFAERRTANCTFFWLLLCLLDVGEGILDSLDSRLGSCGFFSFGCQFGRFGLGLFPPFIPPLDSFLRLRSWHFQLNSTQLKSAH